MKSCFLGQGRIKGWLIKAGWSRSSAAGPAEQAISVKFFSGDVIRDPADSAAPSDDSIVLRQRAIQKIKIPKRATACKCCTSDQIFFFFFSFSAFFAMLNVKKRTSSQGAISFLFLFHFSCEKTKTNYRVNQSVNELDSSSKINFFFCYVISGWERLKCLMIWLKSLPMETSHSKMFPPSLFFNFSESASSDCVRSPAERSRRPTLWLLLHPSCQHRLVLIFHRVRNQGWDVREQSLSKLYEVCPTTTQLSPPIYKNSSEGSSPGGCET